MDLRRRTLVLLGLFLLLGAGALLALASRLAWRADEAAQEAALGERAAAAVVYLSREGSLLVRALDGLDTGAEPHATADALGVDGLVLRRPGAPPVTGGPRGEALAGTEGAGPGLHYVRVGAEVWQVARVDQADGDRVVAARVLDEGRLSGLGLLTGGRLVIGPAELGEGQLSASEPLPDGAGDLVLMRAPRTGEPLIRRIVSFGLETALIAALLATLLLGLVDRTVLRRVQRFAATTERIRAGQAEGARLPVEGADELDRLAESLNGLLTDLESTHARLRHEALHDPLTGLANRNLLLDRLTQALGRGARLPRPPVALLFLDLDRLKVINDHLGHAAGDQFLIEVGARLQACVRPGDTVARLGGDEFALVLMDIDDAQVAASRAEAVLQLLRRPILWRGTSYQMSASIGLAMAGARQDAGQLLREADMAMYEAKSGGRNRVVNYDAVLHGRLAERIAVEAALREALDAGTVEVVFQPIVRTATGEVAGYEALARWTHPTLGVVSPSHFVPIAEESQLITSVDRYVLERAVGAAVRFRSGGHAVFVAVNHSSRSMEAPDLVETVQAALARHGLPPQALVIELPEGHLARNEDRWLPRLRALADTGVGFCLEDFGLSPSSVRRFNELPIGLVKLDPSLVRTLGGQDAVARAVLGLALELGRVVVAEGVESEAERARLAELGCGLLQGYLVGRPEPEGAVLARLGVPDPPRVADA